MPVLAFVLAFQGSLSLCEIILTHEAVPGVSDDAIQNPYVITDAVKVEVKVKEEMKTEATSSVDPGLAPAAPGSPTSHHGEGDMDNEADLEDIPVEEMEEEGVPGDVPGEGDVPATHAPEVRATPGGVPVPKTPEWMRRG